MEFEFYSFSVATLPPQDLPRLTFYVEARCQYSSRHVSPLIDGPSIDRARRRLPIGARIDAGLSREKFAFEFSSNIENRRRVYHTRHLFLPSCDARYFWVRRTLFSMFSSPFSGPAPFLQARLLLASNSRVTFDNLAASFLTLSAFGNPDA